MTILVSAGTYWVSSNLTIDCPVMFSPGAVLKLDTGVTITLAGGALNAP